MPVYPYDTGYEGADKKYINILTGSHISPVGSFPDNGLGLYDMSGNVSQWCWDWAPSFEGVRRTTRGGSWDSNASGCRIGLQGNSLPADQNSILGFRTVMPATP